MAIDGCGEVTEKSVVRTTKEYVLCNGNSLRLMPICGKHLVRDFLPLRFARHPWEMVYQGTYLIL